MAYIGNNLDSDIQVNKYNYIATSGQTDFACTYDRAVDVYVNGLKLVNSDFTATDGVKIVLDSGLNAGDIVDINAYFDVTYGGYDDAQIDDLLDLKADQSTTYTKTEVDDALDLKVNTITSTDNAVVRFNGITGQVQNSTTIIEDDSSIIVNNGGLASAIKMADDESTGGYKMIHANSNLIGFLRGGSSNWIMFAGNDGTITTYNEDASQSAKFFTDGNIYGNIWNQGNGLDGYLSNYIPNIRGCNTEGRHILYNGNLNNIDHNSIYNADAIAPNSPIAQWGFVHTFVHVNTTNWRTQIWYPMQNNTTGIYQRYVADGVNWSAWKQIA